MDDLNEDLFAQQPYGGVAPHVKESDTSREAAVDVTPKAPAIRQQVWSLIAARGPIGATDDEIEVHLNMRHETVSARRRELAIQRFVVDSGRRRNTRRGKAATVWVTPDHKERV